MTLDRDAAVEAVGRLAEQLGLPLAGDGRGDPHDRQLEHGARDPLAHDREGPRPARVRARRVRRRRPAARGRGRRLARHPRGARAAVSRASPRPPGCSTSDLKYDQMRTVFQLQGSIDADRLNRELDGLEAELRGWLARDGVPEADVSVIRALDCRYVGQGYELRVTLDDGPFTEAALERVPPAARARVRQRVRRPDRDRERARHRDRQAADAAGAARRERHLRARRSSARARAHFRVDGQLQALHDALLRPRACSRSTRRSTGPAVVFHLDTTTVVPPGWRARADRSGNLLLDEGGRVMTAVRTRVDPITAAVIARRARLDRGRDGPQAGAHGLLVDHPRVRGLRLRALRRPGPPAVRVVAVDAAAVGPIPGYIAGDQPPLRGARAGVEAGRRRDPQPRLLRRLAPAGRRVRRARLPLAAGSSASRPRPRTTSTSAR